MLVPVVLDVFRMIASGGSPRVAGMRQVSKASPTAEPETLQGIFGRLVDWGGARRCRRERHPENV